jgi:hypothetical protein
MKKHEGGFVGIIILIIIALVALKYFFDFSVFAWAATDEGKRSLIYLKDILVWLKGVVLAAWAYIH